MNHAGLRWMMTPRTGPSSSTAPRKRSSMLRSVTWGSAPCRSSRVSTVYTRENSPGTPTLTSRTRVRPCCSASWTASAMAWFRADRISLTLALVSSIFALALCSISSACSFIVLEYSLILRLFSAISSTSALTASVLLLIVEALLATSCIVAESSSVKAERSEALLFEVCTLPRTSLTTLSIDSELLVIVVNIFWRSSDKR